MYCNKKESSLFSSAQRGFPVSLSQLDKHLRFFSPGFSNLTGFFTGVFNSVMGGSQEKKLGKEGDEENGTDGEGRGLHTEPSVWVQESYFIQLSTLLQDYSTVRARAIIQSQKILVHIYIMLRVVYIHGSGYLYLLQPQGAARYTSAYKETVASEFLIPSS